MKSKTGLSAGFTFLRICFLVIPETSQPGEEDHYQRQ